MFVDLFMVNVALNIPYMDVMCQDFFQPTSWIPVSERTKERKDMLVTRWPKASTTFRVNFSHEEIPKNHRNFEANGWESPAFQLLESLMCSKIYLQQKKTCGQNIVGISTSCRECSQPEKRFWYLKVCWVWHPNSERFMQLLHWFRLAGSDLSEQILQKLSRL